jgi:hypothetical protein
VPDLKFPDALLTAAEAAAYLRRDPGTLANWRSLGEGPAFIRGRPVLYQMSDLAAWVAARRNDPLKDAG